MGKELSLAREEEEGQPVLLASTVIGEPSTESNSGDQRTQEHASSKGNEGGEAKDTKAKSEGSGKVGRANASSSRPARRRRDNKDRKQDRGDEGEDKHSRRSAEELGITYPGSYCDDNKIVPHYWIGQGSEAEGELFQCKLCKRHLWLPGYWSWIERLAQLMKNHGVNKGYCKFLDEHRIAKVLMAKLIDLRRLEVEVSDRREFAKMVDRILSEKEYDRK